MIKHLKLYLVVFATSVLMAIGCMAQPVQSVLWQGNFEPAWEQQWAARILSGKSNYQIIQDPEMGSALRVNYQPQKFGPNAGFQLYAHLREADRLGNAPAEDLYLRYYLRFSPGFEFVRGGKLPGLIAGRSSEVTGGRHPTGTNGFSARYMWTSRGRAIVYLYVPEQPRYAPSGQRFGSGIRLDMQPFVPDRWYCLEQRIKLNTPGEPDGLIQVWLDDQLVAEAAGILFRENDFQIDGIYFSTFYGGNSPDWAPNGENYIDFAQFAVSDRFVGAESESGA